MHIQLAGAGTETVPTPWTAVVLIAAGALWLVGLVVVMSSRSAVVERRAYWLAHLSGGLLAGVAFLPRGFMAGMLVFALVAALSLTFAYFRTPYLLAGGRVVRFAARQQPGTDGIIRYETSSAPKFWWAVAVLSAGVAVVVQLGGWEVDGVVGAAFASAMMMVAGLADGRDGFALARGQFFQAAIIVLSSVFLFGIPVLAYGSAYLAGRLQREHVKR